MLKRYVSLWCLAMLVARCKKEVAVMVLGWAQGTLPVAHAVALNEPKPFLHPFLVSR